MELRHLVVREHVVDDERLRVGSAVAPRPAAANLRAVLVGEPAPGPEVDAPLVVEQDDRRAIHPGRSLESVQSVVEDRVERVRPGDGVREAVDRV